MVENGQSSHKPSPVKSEALKPVEDTDAAPKVVCEGDVCRIVQPGEAENGVKPY